MSYIKKTVFIFTYLLFSNKFIFTAPLEIIPPHLIDDFTLNKTIPIIECFFDDTRNSNNLISFYPQQINEIMIDVLEKKVKSLIPMREKIKPHWGEDFEDVKEMRKSQKHNERLKKMVEKSTGLKDVIFDSEENFY